MIYSRVFPGRQQLMPNVSGRQKPEWGETRGRFTVSSELSRVYVKCIQSRWSSEGNTLRQIVPEDVEILPHRFPLSLAFWWGVIHVLSFLHPHPTLHPPVSPTSWFWISTGHSGSSPHGFHLSPDCENVKVRRLAEGALWSRTAFPGFGLTLCGLEMFGERLMWGLSSLLREEKRERETAWASKKMKKAKQIRPFLGLGFYLILVSELQSIFVGVQALLHLIQEQDVTFKLQQRGPGWSRWHRVLSYTNYKGTKWGRESSGAGSPLRRLWTGNRSRAAHSDGFHKLCEKIFLTLNIHQENIKLPQSHINIWYVIITPCPPQNITFCASWEVSNQHLKRWDSKGVAPSSGRISSS